MVIYYSTPRRPRISEITKSTKKTSNRIFAIAAAVPPIPVKPSTTRINVIIRNENASNPTKRKVADNPSTTATSLMFIVFRISSI